MDINIKEDLKSELILNHVYFSEIHFERQQNISSKGKVDIKFISDKIVNGDVMTVTLSTDLHFKDLFSIHLNLVGEFTCKGSDVVSFYTNAVAILFPFIRSQISILTSQPDFQPIVIPALNINEVLKQNS